MKQRHTPGPWEAAERGGYGDFDGNSRVILADDMRIAVVQHHGDDEAEANTRLIVEAPEMLEALREIADIAHHGGLIGYNTSAKAMDAIRELSQRWWDRKECERLQARRAPKPSNNQI